MTLNPAAYAHRAVTDERPEVHYLAACPCGLEVAWTCRPTTALSGAYSQPDEHVCADVNLPCRTGETGSLVGAPGDRGNGLPRRLASTARRNRGTDQ